MTARYVCDRCDAVDPEDYTRCDACGCCEHTPSSFPCPGCPYTWCGCNP